MYTINSICTVIQRSCKWGFTIFAYVCRTITAGHCSDADVKNTHRETQHNMISIHISEHHIGWTWTFIYMTIFIVIAVQYGFSIPIIAFEAFLMLCLSSISSIIIMICLCAFGQAYTRYLTNEVVSNIMGTFSN